MNDRISYHFTRILRNIKTSYSHSISSPYQQIASKQFNIAEALALFTNNLKKILLFSNFKFISFFFVLFSKFIIDSLLYANLTLHYNLIFYEITLFSLFFFLISSFLINNSFSSFFFYFLFLFFFLFAFFQNFFQKQIIQSDMIKIFLKYEL